MKQIIEHVKSQPVEKQNKIILMCAGIVVGLMLILWLFVGNPNKGSGSNLFQSLSNTFNESKDQFKEFQK